MNALLDPAWALERARRWRRYLPHVLMRQVWNAWLLVWQDGMLEDPPLKRCQEVLGAGVVLWLVGVGVAIALETVAYVLS